ncbi:ribonuclease H-like domain-containing protein [Tanacetum coccineum]
MENEHELSYETLTRVYLGSYEHYKSVGTEAEHPEPGFELQGAKMDAKRPGEDMCGSYKVMWRGYEMSKEGYGAMWRVLVTKPHNKTLLGRKLALGFMRPFRCPVTILNTIDHLGKFDGKADEGFFVGYSINSKAFRVFNSRTRIVEENLHVQFSTKVCDDASKVRMKSVPGKDYILLPLWTPDPPFSQISKSSPDAGFKPSSDDEKKVELKIQEIVELMLSVAKQAMNFLMIPIMSPLEDIGSISELTFFLGLQVKQEEDGIFISQDKYVTEILKKFGFSDVKTASTPVETQKLLLKDEDGEEVDVHLYRLMIGSLMYLTSSRHDIMFAVCACARYQANLKVSHLHAVKRIFSACKKQTVVANFITEAEYVTTEAEYVAASSCYGQLQALVDGKKIIVTEASIRSDLQLDDEEGIDCLQNATIFEELTRISSKTNAWNEFSSTMASAIICLATNQKFIFSKYIFEIMVKNLENVSGKFLMYPRFVQVFLDKQLEGMQSHKRIYDAPSHTKKIFGNMKRAGKGFSGRVTPLFPTMVVKAQEEMGEGSANPTDPHYTPTIIQPSISQPQKKQRSRRSKRKDTKVPQPSGPTTNVADEAVNKEMDDSLERAATTATSLDAEQDMGNINKTQSKTRSENVCKLSNDPLLARGNTLRSGEDSLKLQELMELCTNLQNRVIDLEKTKTSQAQKITSLKLRVKKLEKKGGSRTHKLKRLYKVGLSRRMESSDEEGLDMFGVHDLVGDEVVVESEVAIKAASTIPVSATTTTTTVITDDEITLAIALAELKKC